MLGPIFGTPLQGLVQEESSMENRLLEQRILSPMFQILQLLQCHVPSILERSLNSVLLTFLLAFLAVLGPCLQGDQLARLFIKQEFHIND